MRAVREDMSAERIAELARARGLAVEPAEAERFRAGLNSLLERMGRLADLIPLDTAPPPNRAPR